MSRSIARFCLVVAVLALGTVPVQAEFFRVTLSNGTTIDTAYQPQQASFDPSLVLLLTEVGNWIGVRQDEIESVEPQIPSRGYGVRINTTTVEIGFAPNDAAIPGTEGENAQNADPVLQAIQSLSEGQQPAAPYSVQQFVEPEATQGIPGNLIAPYSGPTQQ